MENLSLALLLTAVGMGTVFCVLVIVIMLGKGIILLVNKYFPEAVKPVAIQSTGNEPSPTQLAAIKSAISTITGGKGNVIKIEKIK